MKERLVNTMDGQILELGFQQWYREGREAERINTLKEQKRADAEALRANVAEARVKEIEANAKNELAQANSYIKELEAKLAQQNT
jgi:hypothetical protein